MCATSAPSLLEVRDDAVLRRNRAAPQTREGFELRRPALRDAAAEPFEDRGEVEGVLASVKTLFGN